MNATLGPIKVLDAPLDLIDNDSAILHLKPGCCYALLLQNDDVLGVAFSGPSSFAVDAIAETPSGAVGRSFSIDLHGIQICLGAIPSDIVSHNATTEEITESGISESLLEETVGKWTRKWSDWDVSQNDSTLMFAGSDDKESRILFVLSANQFVFVYGAFVHVMRGNRLVAISGRGVILTTPHHPAFCFDWSGMHGAAEP